MSGQAGTDPHTQDPSEHGRVSRHGLYYRRLVFKTNAMRVLPALVVLLTGSASAQRVDFVCSNPRLHPGLVLRVGVFTSEGSVPGSVVGPMVRCSDGYLVLGLYPGQDDPEYRVPTHTVHRM